MAHCRLAYAKLSGERSRGHALSVQPPGFGSASIRESRTPVTLTAKTIRVAFQPKSVRSPPALCRHPVIAARQALWMQASAAPVTARSASLLIAVADIIGVRAEPEMLRPHAARIITPMQDVEPAVDRALSDLPGHAVSGDMPVRQPQRAIPGLPNGSLPGPATPTRCRARASLVDLHPEPIDRRESHSRLRMSGVRAGLPATGDPVATVVVLRAELEVPRIHALLVVAAVATHEPERARPFG